MEFATLNTGARMPMEGFGVYQITDLDVCEKSVYEASRQVTASLIPQPLTAMNPPLAKL